MKNGILYSGTPPAQLLLPVLSVLTYELSFLNVKLALMSFLMSLQVCSSQCKSLQSVLREQLLLPLVYLLEVREGMTKTVRELPSADSVSKYL